MLRAAAQMNRVQRAEYVGVPELGRAARGGAPRSSIRIRCQAHLEHCVRNATEATFLLDSPAPMSTRDGPQGGQWTLKHDPGQRSSSAKPVRWTRAFSTDHRFSRAATLCQGRRVQKTHTMSFAHFLQGLRDFR